MDSRPSQEAPAPATETSRLGRLAGFFVFTTAGMAALASAVLLPEYAALVEVRRQRDVFAHQVGCEGRLAAYNGRMIQAAQDDPVFVARAMMRQGNYRPTNCQVMEVPTTLPQETVPQRLARESSDPPPPAPDVLAATGAWMDHPSITGGLVLMGMGLLAVGGILFGPGLSPASEPPAGK